MSERASMQSQAPRVGRWMSHTPGLLGRRPWVWPLFAAALLCFVGIWVRARVERAMQEEIAANLQTILRANAEALQEWAAAMRSLAEVLASDDRVRELSAAMLARAQAPGSTPATLTAASEAAAMAAYLEPVLERRGFNGYALLDTNLVIIAAGLEQTVGLKVPPKYTPALELCLEGKPSVTRPFLAPNLRDDTGKPAALMFAAAPIRSRDGRVTAVLGLRILPEDDFTRILGTARSGRSGETFAFDGQGVLLSESRFDDELKRLGLIPDMPGARSILALEARDPLVNLQKGKQPPRRRSELPFTRPVSEALAGRPGADAAGYRDYRGVPVVGAWTWLDDFDMGLATQLERREAFAPALPVRIAFWFLFGLLTLGSAVVFLLMRVARQKALEANQLGQYCLESEIGSGGFGKVYRARHALMRRPVAVKVLDPLAGPTSIARFEREVQMTSHLTHPNTIALFDYGRTPEGLFYYAMEFLEGLSLAALVKEHGPLPEGRVIHILRQACASLAEAHALGLVHRDIKPHNILLTRRGGIPDFVKVLDFGLVKASETPKELELTAAHATMGTPLYMSPEAVKGADTATASSDIYSLGAVAYELLTGETVFSGTSLAEVILHQVRSHPQKPSARLGRPVSADLENLIMSCLSKNPSARPTAAALEEALSRCASTSAWTRADAEAWWTRNAPQVPASTPRATTPCPSPAELVGHRM